MNLKNSAKIGMVEGLEIPPIRQLTHRLLKYNSIIFMLHRFDDPSIGSKGHNPDFLRKCLKILRNQNYKLVSVDEIITAAKSGNPLKNAVAFTVDDGYLDHATIGATVFAEYDCPATFFLITDFVDGTYWPYDAKIEYILENTQQKSINITLSDRGYHFPTKNVSQRKQAAYKLLWGLKFTPLEQLKSDVDLLAKIAKVDITKQPPPLYSNMSWEDARKLEKKGMLIGAHTQKHALLSAENEETARSEIIGSIDKLKQNLQRPSKVFCYPTGRYSDFGEREQHIANSVGCIGAVSAEPDYMNSSNINSTGGFYSIPRFGFPDNLVDFKEIILYVERIKQLMRNTVN